MRTDDCCDVRTTGRRTGEPHEVEIWFGVIDGTMYLISGNGPDAVGIAMRDRLARDSPLERQTHDGVAATSPTRMNAEESVM